MPSAPFGLFTGYFPSSQDQQSGVCGSSTQAFMCQQSQEWRLPRRVPSPLLDPPQWQCWFCHGGMLLWLGFCSFSLLWIIPKLHSFWFWLLLFILDEAPGFALEIWILQESRSCCLFLTTGTLVGRKRNTLGFYSYVSRRAGQGGVQMCLYIKYLGVCMSLCGTVGLISK